MWRHVRPVPLDVSHRYKVDTSIVSLFSLQKLSNDACSLSRGREGRTLSY